VKQKRSSRGGERKGGGRKEGDSGGDSCFEELLHSIEAHKVY